jgi:hypothetical protein
VSRVLLRLRTASAEEQFFDGDVTPWEAVLELEDGEEIRTVEGNSIGGYATFTAVTATLLSDEPDDDADLG